MQALDDLKKEATAAIALAEDAAALAKLDAAAHDGADVGRSLALRGDLEVLRLAVSARRQGPRHGAQADGVAPRASLG